MRTVIDTRLSTIRLLRDVMLLQDKPEMVRHLFARMTAVVVPCVCVWTTVISGWLDFYNLWLFVKPIKIIKIVLLVSKDIMTHPYE